MAEQPSRFQAPARLRQALWGALAGLWLLAVAGGLVVVARYDNGAGAPAAAGRRWPHESGLTPDQERPTLVMLAHPRCSCTRASLVELAEILARTGDRLRAYVVFAKPGRLEGDSAATALWEQASRIPGVSLIRDDEGREAAAFGTATSGQVLVYGPAGDLLFSGGTTPSRGHSGDNVGRQAILDLAARRRPAREQTPVFGCPLLGPADVPPAAPRTHS